VAKCVANALQASCRVGDAIRTLQPEELLMMWGFTDDLAKARRSRKPEMISKREAIANMAELIN
jgi:hypothetical protein